MGANDAAEMLEVAKEQAILDERTIARLEQKLAAVRNACDSFEADGHGDAVSITTIRAIVNSTEETPAA